MEMSALLQSHSSLCCHRRRTAAATSASASSSGTTILKTSPILGTVVYHSSSFCHKGVCGIIRFTPKMAASSDYPRRRWRKNIVPKTKIPTPKGFAPRPQVGTSTQKKDQNDNEENGQVKLKYSEMISSSIAKKVTTVNGEVRGDEPAFVVDRSDEKKLDDMPGDITLGFAGLSVTDGNRDVEDEITPICHTEDVSKYINSAEQKGAVEEADKSDVSVSFQEKEIEYSMVQKQAEIDAEANRQMLECLAEENTSNGVKVFFYPKEVTANQVIEVFFNRQASNLINQPDVLITGAFNNWRWNIFTERLQKSNLKGDWWTSHLHIPKEAYKMDFVFSNGGDVYENNDNNDFLINVEGGMAVLEFEDFLLEEKRKELEKLALEEAERERQAEEKRKKEEENAAKEVYRAHARSKVAKRREALDHVLKLAVTSVDNLWQIEPHPFKAKDRIRLFYKRTSRPLSHSKEIWFHGGHNSWSDGLSIIARLFPFGNKDDDWWYVDVVLPDHTLVLDWVFADGPPGTAKVYDNNNTHDFHAIVPNKISEELYWAKEEEKIYKNLQEERKTREKARLNKLERMAQMKAERKETSLQMFLSQRHIFYTEPLVVQAGSTVTVFYNPSSTVLNDKPEVWFRCSFNRWTHPNGPLPPQKMVHAGDGSLVKTSVKVPPDAYTMDFVFSEKEDGGIEDGGLYDNRNGMDYHIPVSGGISREPPIHVVHIAVEMAPIAKVGGLGDVVTSLSRAVQELGHNVEIILPKYDCMNLSNAINFNFYKSFGWSGIEIKVWLGKVEGLSVYFLEPQNGMFSAGCIYGCRNDGERFGFFCHAALEFLHQKGAQPDILHCHDWSSAPVAWLFKEQYRHYALTNARVILTIHNLEFGAGLIGKAMLHADKATTVSQTYAREVSGNPVIAPHLQKFHGIVNGIDPDIWDPCNDSLIPLSYTSDNVVEGKRAAKEALQQRLGLQQSEYPIVGIISRLTVQKGIHLIKHAISRTLERNGQVVLLGSAPDHRIQNDFVNLANQLHSSHGDRVRLCLTYDEPLSHLIYAGSDFILVPSIFEPCGLTQLIAMRYGSIPIVRKTGGLYDTVYDVDDDKGRAEAQGLEPNGFSFDGADSGGVDYALNRALSAWFNDRTWFNSFCKRVMEQDWSWNGPALDYIKLYHSARKL